MQSSDHGTLINTRGIKHCVSTVDGVRPGYSPPTDGGAGVVADESLQGAAYISDTTASAQRVAGAGAEIRSAMPCRVFFGNTPATVTCRSPSPVPLIPAWGGVPTDDSVQRIPLNSARRYPGKLNLEAGLVWGVAAYRRSH